MAGRDDLRGDLPSFDDDSNMSDAELDSLLAGAMPGAETSAREEVEPGENVDGVVIACRDGEILVELHHKVHGVVDQREFGDDPPTPGSPITARFERFDHGRDLAVLSVSEARREFFWGEVSAGNVYEGTAIEVNKGGLTLDIRGARAFLPISQISRERVEDPAVYVGRKLEVEVVSFDREAEDLVVSRRAILDREAEVTRHDTVKTLTEGQVVEGTVTRVNEHGAFVDLGGVDGLLHVSRIRDHAREFEGEKPLEPGHSLFVEIMRVDRERGRVSLDFHEVASAQWDRAIEDYEVGQSMTVLVTRSTSEGVLVLVEEGVEGRLVVADGTPPPRKGALVSTVITAIDQDRQEILLEPR